MSESDERLLDAMLQDRVIRCVYQPIVELDTGVVVGYEALARGPVGSPLEQPGRLFATAARAGRVAELDRACRAAAFAGARAAGLQYPSTLFVNFEPTSARTGMSLPPVRRTSPRAAGGATSHQVVIELTERALTARPAELLQIVARMRAKGWGVAVDDVGADPNSLALLPLLRPDVIKLDLSLVQQRPSAQVARIVSAVNAEAERSGSVVLAEGIETEAHRAIALSVGATLGQGWLLGRPAALPAALAVPTEPALPLLEHGVVARERTPYQLGAALRSPRIGVKALLIEISKHLERRALESGESTVVLATFQDLSFFTDATSRRYADLASRSAFVGALGAGMRTMPVPGVRGASLDASDPLIGEWDLVVVGPHFAAALVARDLGDGGPDGQRRFSFVMSHDRELAIACATLLMARTLPEPSQSDLPQTPLTAPLERPLTVRKS